jgi:hypothetical protein
MLLDLLSAGTAKMRKTKLIELKNELKEAVPGRMRTNEIRQVFAIWIDKKTAIDTFMEQQGTATGSSGEEGASRLRFKC